jgi:hypothetical protein
VNPWRLEGSAESRRKIQDEIIATKVPEAFRLCSGDSAIQTAKETSTCGIALRGPRQ